LVIGDIIEEAHILHIIKIKKSSRK